MATSGPTLLPAFFNTDADFRAWVAGVRAALEACGMVRTADTGQIDAATVVKPAAINTPSGYDIFRLNDAAQATCPVFLKLEYGSGGAVDRPSIWFTVGQGSNGAGTLTGNLTLRSQRAPFTSKTAGVTLPLYCCGDGSGVFLVFNLDNANVNFNIGFMLDRPRLANGSPTAEGIQTLNWSQSTGSWHFIPDSGTPPAAHGTTQAISPGIGESKVGTEVAMSPYLIVANGRVRFGKMYLSYFTADVAELAAFTVSEFLGAGRVYMPLGDGMSASSPFTSSTGSCSPAMLWE